jgi:hypothetical protein
VSPKQVGVIRFQAIDITSQQKVDASIAPRSPSQERTTVIFLSTLRAEESKKSPYATGEDFRKLFTDEANSLYLLSFLLTAEHEMAERCVRAALDECMKGNSAFQASVRPWARRMIIRKAIQMIMPRPEPSKPLPGAVNLAGNLRGKRLQDAPFASILALEDFERFIYVLSVLERYQDLNCALLLGASAQEVRDARLCALQHIAGFKTGQAAPAGEVSRPGQG